jgi:metal-responsive CopG/Arc/MetJ family transcriptional regulator
METNKLIPYSVYLPSDLHRKLKSLAKERKASELIRNAIHMIIEGNTAYNSGYNKALKDVTKVIDTNEDASTISMHGHTISETLISDIKTLEMSK